jgi:catechol 2,3-dioxygenase-like lactoylglutathione lyase family enzyme
MLGSADLIAFAATSDLDRAVAFYGEILGLALIDRNDFACVFDANGTMLRVTAVPRVALAGYAVLGWRVTDIVSTVEALANRGVVFMYYDSMDQDENGVWTTPGGDKVAWFTDLDGNTLSLTQFNSPDNHVA